MKYKKSELIAFKLGADDLEKLKAIQEFEHRDNRSDQLRVLIRRRFLELGLPPVRKANGR